MAIVVEQEKNKSNMMGPIVAWATVIVIVGVAAYYIFFITPQAVPLKASTSQAALPAITAVSTSTTAVFDSPEYKALKQSSIAEPQTSGPMPVSKSNPFIP